MRAKKTGKQTKVVSFDSKKESVFRELSGLLQKFGYSVRREKLKQGHGWKAVSGACRAGESRIIFVDRRMSQSDQLSFLAGKIITLDKSALQNELPSLSEDARRALPDDEVLAGLQLQDKDQLLAS